MLVQLPIRMIAMVNVIRIALCLLLTASIGLPQVSQATDCLMIRGEEPDRVLVSVPIEAESLFCLEFINSIYLAPVKEIYMYEPAKGISIVKVESPSAGVFEYYGLVPDNSGAAAVSLTVKEMRLRSHDYKNHTITVNDRKIGLKGLVQDGQPLIVRIGVCGK
jgi:hypothetical protein